MNRIQEYLKTHREEIDLEKSQEWHSHFDKLILDYVKDTDNGFFVEAGANIAQNTSILYECGWSGMLIEPSRSSYMWCLENRPNCINENCALVSSEFEGKTILGSQSTEIHKSIHLFGYPYMDIDGTSEIPAHTFSSLCKKHNVKKIDVFFLDTEGYEMEILKGIDFEECFIRFFVIECNSDHYSFESLKDFMENKGFELVCNFSNFTRENSPRWPGTHQDYLFKNKKNSNLG
jgi:FkbM family methyltransferase